MKKFFTNINLQVFKIRIIQIILVLVAAGSFYNAERQGTDFNFASGEPTIAGQNEIPYSDGNSFRTRYRTEQIIKETHPAYNTGANGGAIGMSLICSTCIICVVILETLVFIRKKSIND